MGALEVYLLWIGPEFLLVAGCLNHPVARMHCVGCEMNGGLSRLLGAGRRNW